MRKFVTTLWCAALAAAGYFITSMTTPTDIAKPNAMYAATLPSWNNNGQLPLDLMLDKAKITNFVDTVEIHDTVLVNNTKYIKVSVPENTTDTLYMPLYVPNHVEGVPVNAVKTEDGNKSTVVLTVDGKVVYTTDRLKEP